MTDTVDIWGNPTSIDTSTNTITEPILSEEAMDALTGDSPAPVAEEVANPEYEDTKEKFAELVKNRRNRALIDIGSEIEASQERYEVSTRDARNHLWTVNDLRSTQAALQQVEETKEEALHAEFDALLRHAKVDAVGIRDDQILIKTVHLDISDPDTGDSYDLGEFEIVIPTTARRAGRISILNRTNARERDGQVYHHPHVVGDNPCFGAIEDQLITQLAQGEYGGAFELLLQYLQTYNPEDSYGDHISLWGGDNSGRY